MIYARYIYSVDTDGNHHIYSINANGSGLLRLTGGLYNDSSPIYSPDEDYILYRRLPSDFDTGSGPPYPYELVLKKVQ